MINALTLSFTDFDTIFFETLNETAMNQLYPDKEPYLHDWISHFEQESPNGSVIPMDEQPYLRVIQYFEEEVSLHKALEITDTALRQHKFSSSIHAKKALLLLQTSAPELALESLDRAEWFGMSFIEVDLIRIKAYVALFDFSRAQKVVDDLRNFKLTKEQECQTFVMEAEIFRVQKDYYSMYRALKMALTIIPDNEQALKQIWLAMEMSRQYDDCLDFHHELLEKDAYQYLTWFNLGHAYYNKYEYSEAMDAFEYSYVINELFLPAYLDYIETAIHQQKFFLAINCLENARRHFDLDEEMLFKMALCHQKIKLYDKARTYFYRAKRMDTYNSDTYFHLGECYAAEQRYREAIYHFKTAIDLQPEVEEYHLGLALAYAGNQQEELATEQFELAINSAAHRNEFWAAYATWHLTKKRYEQALTVLEEAEEYTYGTDLCYLKAACLANIQKDFHPELIEGLKNEPKNKNLFFDFAPVSCQEDTKIKGMLRYYEVI